ncbi:MAG: cytochrome c oxidase subunit II [Verrucomicrobiota bacterium]
MTLALINEFLGMPVNAAAHGYKIDHMLEVVHWFMLILFIGWIVFFFITLFKFTAKKNPKASYKGVKNKFSTHLEISVVLVEAFLLLIIAIPLWIERVNEFPDEEKAIVVHAIAEQYGWNYHYPGADRKFGKKDPSLITSDNPIGLDRSDPDAKDDILAKTEMHLPINQEAIIRITSKDVIHNFALPHMRIAQDAIPGVEVPMWFTPVRTGEYEIICGQLCGVGHYSMKGWLMIDEDEDYKSWLKENALRQGVQVSMK